MSLSLNNLTFIIVTFKSEHIIHECLSSLPKNSKIIIIENSNNEKLKSEQNYDKVLPNTEKIILQAEEYIKNS